MIGFAGLVVAACGKKGPPIAPERRLPVPPTGIQTSIDADSILVSWTNPDHRIDGSSLKDLKEVKLFRHQQEIEGPLKPAILSRGRVVGYEQIATIRVDAPEPATVVGTRVQWVDRLGLEPDHRYVYVLTAIDADGRSSPPSERRPVMFLAAPMPPSDMQAAAGNRQVMLTWRAPTELIDGSPVSGELRYVVLRGAGSAGVPTVITTQPLATTSYTDTGLENETEYRYSVRAVRVDPRATVTGPPSVAVAARPIETARPTPPRNLVVVPSSGVLRLAWSPNPEANVAQYAVYRAAGTAALVRIGTTASGSTTFTDRDVRPGTTYRYAVTAIDNSSRANESEPSQEVTVTLP
ncbi:MAG TPA: fibronectin type III domain-containing protein [Candidatus Methylomirabilis sp.]|nr:fibronectin type III domain-containing protein [Candidatus Methylomirabilis sp.]